jgi:hypothetical protein
MQTPAISLLLRRILPALAAVALLAIGAPTAAAAAAKTLPKSQQGSYSVKSFVVVFKGQNEHTKALPETIKIGPAGLGGGTKSVIVSVLTNKANLHIVGLKLSGIKSALTSFSASFTGSGVFAGTTVKATLSSTTLVVNVKFVGVLGGQTGTGTAVITAKRT